MMQTLEFQPEWASPPGETISELLAERELTVEDMVSCIGLSKKEAIALLNGNLPVCDALAENLQMLFKVSAEFWLSRESTYRSSLQYLSQKQADEESWLNSLPLSDLKKWGFIPSRASVKEQLKAALSFFGVSSVDEWDASYAAKQNMVAFRTSSSFDSAPMSVLTWLRKAEIDTEQLKCEEWNSDSLLQAIPEIRKLTREDQPEVFMAELKKLLATCGVALAFVKTPKGCSASGATYFPEPNRALIVLSGRYLTDDHLWFTVFHEIGHLILHSKDCLFLEGTKSSAKEEHEANMFAEQILVPAEHMSEMLMLSRVSDWRRILRFAKKIGISPGIVVGQLQHKGKISFAYLNNLKKKYRWAS